MTATKKYSSAKSFRVALEAKLKPERVKESLDVVFSRRNTHKLPDKIDPPPNEWKPVFEKMARECNVNTDIERTFNSLVNFINDTQGRA